MRNFKLTICYDGSRYKGWQRQGNTENTLQARLEAILSRMLEQPVELSGSGRTDAGVHARRQVCSFRVKTGQPCEALLAQLRGFLPEDVGALSLEEAESRFHARLSCTGKTYVYRIWNSDLPDVFQRRYRLTVPEPLDLSAMEKAAVLLCGEHDFTSFCANRHMKKSAVRNLSAIRIVREGDAVSIWYTGNGFLYNMVRILTGTLLEVGLGRRDAGDMPAILEARDRSRAGFTAPPQALFLWDVCYDPLPDKADESWKKISIFSVDSTTEC
ncbi:MAG: tRNA pseudouridine(38-40) synthase TruA [Oscillospiraceae bacterium]|nr:tRNA pseudouridine(38-40) synthase TruA [Oscillospiraceae bacterium]